jgi:hypothetical protein
MTKIFTTLLEVNFIIQKQTSSFTKKLDIIYKQPPMKEAVNSEEILHMSNSRRFVIVDRDKRKEIMKKNI